MDEFTFDATPIVSSNNRVAVRYWAGARAAAETEREELAAETVHQLKLAAIAAHPALADVMPRCSVLVDGRRSDDDVSLRQGAQVEFLPPFAGG